MRVSPCVTTALWPLLLLAAVGAPARAQIPGVAVPGVSAPVADSPDAFGTSTPQSVRTSSAPSADAGGLLGLQEPAHREVLTLADVLARAGTDAADVRIAAERVVQQEASLRKAWAAVLPQVSLNGSYTLACSGGGDAVLSCADRTAQLADPKQLESEATLFDGIAGGLAALAAATADNQQKQDLLDQAAQLNAGAVSIRNAAKNAKPVVVQPANVFTGSLNASLPLFNGRAFPLLYNAYDAVSLANRAKEQVKSALLYSTMRGYYAAVTAQKLVGIAREQVASAERHKEITRARVDAATQPPLALKRAELDALRAREQAESAQAAYDAAIAAIGLVINRAEAFDVVDPGAPPPAPVGTADALMERALQHRPDIAAEKLSLTMAERGELDAWMMFAPSVNLVASAHATSFTSGFVTDPITGTIAITASVPLYDGGQRYGALKDSASRIREETIRLRQLEDRVRAQVRGNLRDVASKARARALTAEAVDVARAAREQAQAAFEGGVGTSVDVSDTALALFLAENDAARADLDLALAQAGLSYVVGGDE